MNEKIYEVILNPVAVACIFVGSALIGGRLTLEYIRKRQSQEDE